MKPTKPSQREQLLDELAHLKYLLMSHPDISDLPLLTDRIDPETSGTNNEPPLTTQQAAWISELTEAILTDCQPLIRQAIRRQLIAAQPPHQPDATDP